MFKNYRLVVTLLSGLLLLGCSSDDMKKVKKALDKTGDQVNETVEKYKGNRPKVIADGENSPIPSDEIKQMIDLQNQARAEVGIDKSRDLFWSDAIAKDAQKYADVLARSGAFSHDPKNHKAQNEGGYENGPYGENLYASWSSNGQVPSYIDAAKAWIDEKKDYHYGKIDSSGSDCNAGKQCGHYTQIVWKDTPRIGCARSRYKDTRTSDGFEMTGYVIVCKYKIPGNIIGEYPY